MNGLRVAVLAAGWWGLLALVLADLLGAGSAAVAGLLAAGAAWLASRAMRPSMIRTRTALAYALLAAVVPVLLLGPSAGSIGAPLMVPLVVMVFLAQSTVATRRRDLMVALIVAIGMLVLAVGTSPGPVLAVPVLGCWVAAVTALVLAHTDGQREGVDRARVVPSGPSGTSGRAGTAGSAGSNGGWAGWPVVRVVTTTVLVGLLCFLLLPRVDSGAGGGFGAGGFGAGNGVGPPRSATAYTTGDLDLRARGELGDEPILDVPGDSPGLWRGSVLDTYTGVGWTSLGGFAVELSGTAEGDRRVRTQVPDPEGPAGAADPAAPVDRGSLVTLELRTDEVRLHQAFGGVLVAPGHAVSVESSGGVRIDGSGAVLVGHEEPGYTVVFRSSSPAADVVADASGADHPDPRWTRLPPTVPDRVRLLAAQLEAGARGEPGRGPSTLTSSRQATVAAVEEYLRTSFTYDLDSPVPARGADAVDDFLFVSRRGFCEQFASAGVVLLRSVGIPARLVTGFADDGPSPEAAAGWRTIAAKNSHAWVEVWYPGVGWIASDPTASATLAEDGSVLAQAASWVNRSLVTASGRIQLAAGVLAALAAGAIITTAIRRRSRRRTDSRWDDGHRAQHGRSGPLLVAFGRLDSALSRQGRQRRPQESITDLGRRLPLTAEGRQALVALEREVYGGVPPDPAETESGVRALDTMAGSNVALCRWRGRRDGGGGGMARAAG